MLNQLPRTAQKTKRDQPLKKLNKAGGNRSGRETAQPVDESTKKQMLKYKDDLEFLNKLDPEEINDMSSMFKNEGRGIVKRDRINAAVERTQAVIGIHKPKYEAVQRNTSQRLLTIPPIHDEANQERIERISKQKTKMCDRFLNK